RDRNVTGVQTCALPISLLAVIIGALTVYLAYTFYARRIDRHVIQSDPKRATPATLYMDGVDFMPTNKNILFGYHFKSIAAAGPIDRKSVVEVKRVGVGG